MRRVLPPLLIIAVSLAAAWAMILSHEPPGTRATIDLRTWAEVVRAEPQTLRLSVRTQGSVEPRMESEVVAEVGGRLVEVSAALEAGGFFDAGDVLLRIDDRDYRNAVARARAVLDRARSELSVQRKSRTRMDSLTAQGLVSESDLDNARNAELIAEATVAEATALLAGAELDLERTVVQAPFAGRVRDRHVGAGQFVLPGVRLAKIYATDSVEIRLPLSVDDLAFLELPLAYSAANSDVARPVVRLSAEIGNRTHEWVGAIERTEGALDPATGNVVAVARVEDPYGLREPGQTRVPLAPGLFVRAEIIGREVERAFSLPAAAYRAGIGLLVVDDQDRLRIREVRVLRRDAGQVVVADGIAAGERVVVSAVESPIDGMEMRVTLVEYSAGVPSRDGP